MNTVFGKSSLQWRHNGPDGVSNYQRHHCLLSRLFGRSSKKRSKLRVAGLCAGNSPGTGEFPVQRASNAENGSIWRRHHVERYDLMYNTKYVNQYCHNVINLWGTYSFAFNVVSLHCMFYIPCSVIIDHLGYGLSQWENKLHSIASPDWLSLYPQQNLVLYAVSW